MSAEMSLTIKTLFLWFFLSSGFGAAYKIAVFVPAISNSQVILSYRFAEVLANAGHRVTLIRLQYSPSATLTLTGDFKEQTIQVTNREEYEKMMSAVMRPTFLPDTLTNLIDFEVYDMAYEVMMKACLIQIHHESLLKLLGEQDLVVAQHLDFFCNLGLIHAAKVPTYIWSMSMTILDSQADLLGVPLPASYVPGCISPFGDQMNWWERLVNLFLIQMFQVSQRRAARVQTEMFRQHFGEDFPSLEDLAADSPLMFAFAEELLEFPRPILHKTIYVGGLGMGTPRPLDNKWKALLEKRDAGAVLVSFGSIANASEMSMEWKLAFVKSFATFPNVTFIWKYDTNDLKDLLKNHPNIHLTSWVPQKDLLGHPKLRGFITHGGYNSLLEAAYAGVPLLTIPLFFDQFGVALRAEKHGIGIILRKKHFSQDGFTNAIHQMLFNSKYVENARKMSRKLKGKPIKPETLAVGWVEFLAEHKELDSLSPLGRKMSFIEYFMLDSLLIVFLISVGFCVSFCLSVWLCCKKCSDKYRKMKRE